MQKYNDVYRHFQEILNNPKYFKKIIDNVNEKYNNQNWKNLSIVQPEQISRKWNEVFNQTNISVMATIGDEKSPVPMRATTGVETFTGSIPAFGHGFKFNVDDLLLAEEANITGDAVLQYLAGTYINRAGAIIQGIHNRINYFVYQAMGQGIISTTDANNPDGVKYTYSYDIPTQNKQCAKGGATAKWTVTGATSTADPIADVQRWCEILKDNKGVANPMLVMNKTTFKMFVKHPAVISQLGARMTTLSTLGLENISDANILSKLREIFDIPPILVVDAKMNVESDGKITSVNSPFPDNIVSVLPIETPFDLYHCPSVYSHITKSDIVTSTTENGLIYSMKEVATNGLETKTSFQAVAAPILRRPDCLIIADVNSNSSDGVRA